MVMRWLCSSCDLNVMPDGAAQGIVFSSPNSAFTEVFLFNVAYRLVANGSSLTGSALQRQHLVELCGETRLPLAATDLRVSKMLRQGLMLYMELVVAGMPACVLRCKMCVLPNGSYDVLRFLSLYQGIRAKHHRDMARIKVPLDIAARAVAACSFVHQNQVVLALSCSLWHAQADSKGKFEALRFKSIGAIKGAMYAIVTLFPTALSAVDVPAADVNVAVGSVYGRGEQDQFDPVTDNKLHPALVHFIRIVLLGKDAALILARAVVDSPRDICTKLSPYVLTSLARLISAAEQSGDQDPPPQGPDRRRAAVFDELALAHTEGERGASRAKRAKISWHPCFPTTVNAAPKVFSFVRALCAGTVFSWSFYGDWGALQMVLRTLDGRNWSEGALEVALGDPRVRELRLLRGAVACLIPAMAAWLHTRHALRAVLAAVVDTAGHYDDFVRADGAADLVGDPPLTGESVAYGCVGRSIMPSAFDDLWLQPVLSSSLTAA